MSGVTTLETSAPEEKWRSLAVRPELDLVVDLKTEKDRDRERKTEKESEPEPEPERDRKRESQTDTRELREGDGEI